MSVHGAKIIDLEERRRARQRCDAERVEEPALLMPPLFAMTWVPMWFVPMFVPGHLRNFG